MGASFMRVFQLFHSIKSKLLIIAFFILTIPLIVLGVFSYNKSNASLDRSGEKRLETSVEITYEMIEGLYNEVENGNLSLEEAQEMVKIAILGEKSKDGTRAINENIDLGEFGYLFITDSEGNLQAHPNIEGENTWDKKDVHGDFYAQKYIQTAIEGGGVSHYTYPLPTDENQIEDKVTYSKFFPEWDWVIVAGTYMSDFNAEANEILRTIFIVIGVTLIIGIGGVWIFVNRISRPINEVAEHMTSVAQADLSQEKLEIRSKDETGQLANALNYMQDGLRNLIGNVLDASGNIASQSEELTQAANEVSEGTEQVASTMEELAAGSETQANRSGEIASMMNTFITRLEEANTNGENVNKASTEVLKMTQEGSQLMDDSTNQMNAIDQIVQDAVAKVEGLDEHSQQISELVSVIQDIAEQTNLLALNAAIEAARAGEHGQGFAVVADEVRQLAEESANSVAHITQIVEQIQSESSVVADSLRTGYEEVERGTTQINSTGETFGQINDAVIDMADRIQAISNNLEDIVSNSQEVNAAIEDISAVSEESAAGVEETTATTEQSNATMLEIAACSDDLTTLAEELHELVNEFEL